MHSSISNSDTAARHARPDRFTVLLLGTVLVLLGLIEAVSVLRFDRTSRVQQREVAQRKILLEVKDPAIGEDPHLAVLGNSLMLNGVDLPLLAEKLGSKVTPVPYFVLATNYYDWYFGLKRMFAEGMRPRYVLLGLSPNQLAASDIRGDYSARYLFQQSDLIDVIRQTHMDATTASGFLLSHYSEFYSTRDITRGFIMNRVFPSVGELLHNQAGSVRDPEIAEPVLYPLAAKRLAELDRLCRENGAHFMLVVPPTYQKGAETIAQAGKSEQITVLVPVATNVFDSTYYQSDGFHLNDVGARVFTSRLADGLQDKMTN
ncbi:MAG TPA: hypothetical protein VH079_11200 [Terriglobales bacterium]|jgi:lysophospholipase L1-like esterase|nr:hypothetical protein [Terriglobales bacterium]